MSSLVHITILKKELEWLDENASQIQRLKRAVVREYLNTRVRTLSQELEEIQLAKDLLKKQKTTRVLIKKSKETELDI
jgi:hypothetical protein|tara:strand:- start:2208 stop:2441 length:234 start_codon:yes stop_codon:yes gene_type:complete